MILITQNDFTSRTGIDLTQDIREDGQSVNAQADTLIERWERFVYKTAFNMGSAIKDDLLNENQINAIKDAVASYGLYCLQNGDYESLGKQNGVDPVLNIIKELKNYGIIHSNCKGRF